jgi:hypothetical protein
MYKYSGTVNAVGICLKCRRIFKDQISVIESNMELSDEQVEIIRVEAIRNTKQLDVRVVEENFPSCLNFPFQL